MIKYRLYAPNDGDTMTVDGGGGWDSPANDDRKGGNDRNNDKGGSAVDFSKNPEKQAIVNPYLAVALPMPVYPIYGTPGFTINTAVIETGLARISAVIGRALPVAGRLLGVTVGAMWPSSTAPGSLDSIYNQAHQQALAQLAAQQGVLNKGYNVTAMPAGLVSSLPVSEIKSLPTAPASLLAQSVINTELSQRQLTLTQPATNAPVANIPVVKAEKTAVPGVYSAKIIAGEPAFQIKVDNTKPALAQNPPKVKDDIQVSSFLSSPVADTHHAFIDFGSDHEPVYVSLSKIVTAEEEKKQVEEAKRREQEWLLRHPIEAAERKLIEIRQVLSFAQQLKESSTATISEKNKTVAVYQEQVNTAAKNRDNFYNQNRGLLSAGITGGPGYPIYLALWQTMNNFHQAYFTVNNALEQDSQILNQARSDLAKAEQLLTENNRLQVETERTLAEEKEIKRNRVNVSTFGTVQTQLRTLLSAFYAATSGSTTSISQNVPSGALASFSYKPQGTIGNGKVVGKDVDILFSIPVKDIPGYKSPANLGDLAKKRGNLELPVRLAFSEENGNRVLRAFKTDGLRVPSTVRGVAGSHDKNTGIFSAEIGGVPSRLVLENPAFPPTGNVGNTGNTAPDYKALLNTGVDVKPVDKITVTTTPVADPVDIDDYIIWLPTASGSGVEPIYVVFNSNPYGGTEKGKYSKRYYNPDKAGGPILELDWKNVKIDRAGVDNVKLHTGRFKASVENKVMIERLENILNGQIAATDTDKRFYTHELRELNRYRNLGIKDGEVPSSIQEESAVWNDTHTATLEDYKINEKEQPLYTDAALQAAYEQELKDALGGKHG
ncbi:colicin-like bacteriocin tRNase domain-containing protein [Pectobacterium brasiliense]|uniref:colicin-like bacteriocin tRNase domain-containing protein n=1 Tax=Pectobacterium brasiliense TaxID=180957 RepID=UPI0019696F74|nr:colicin-like bacteriocin tRNase domain-containing protein [Pectobacterium brasiliense]MBN3263552.1 S-type pyocin domain-containing protein [Pectobacterium brasiliense]